MLIDNGSGTKYCIASATSATFHVGTQTEDSSTKDSTGDWAESEIVGLSWDASTDALVVASDPVGASGKSTPDIMSLILGKTLVHLQFSTTTPGSSNNRTATAGVQYTGTAYITDVNITAPNRANSTISVTFTGTGALTAS